MNSKLLKFGCAAFLMAGSVSVITAQTTTTTTTKKEIVVNPDGSYTVIEYPVGKEVMINLQPGTTVVGSKGNARVLRAADGTKVYVDLNGVPSTVTNAYVYAVDPAGVSTMLGPVTFKDGVAKGEFMTPMNQFMLVVSPDEGLTTIDPATNLVYRSDLPTGYKVVPRVMAEIKGEPVNTAVVSTTPAVSTTTVSTPAGSTTTVSTVPAAYEVPLLNVPTFGNKEKEVKLKFGGELTGLEAKAYIDREKGTTKIKMRFDELQKVPVGKRVTLWASSTDGKYTKLGQIINSGQRKEAEIRSETALTDFGLFLTVEDAEVAVPTSRIYSVFGVPGS